MSTPPHDPNEQPRYGGQEPSGDSAPGYGSSPAGPSSGSSAPGSSAPGYGAPGQGSAGYGAGGSDDAARYGGQQPPAYGSDHGHGHGSGASPRNGLGVAALVVGVISLLLSCLVVPGIVGGIVGTVLGVMGRTRAARGEATNKGVATTGLVRSLVALVLGILFLVLFSLGFAASVPFLEQVAAECQGLEGAQLDACLQEQTTQLEDQLGG